MKETIIFSNINQFALLRLLAQYGVNTVGYRVFDNNSILSFIREKTGNLSSKKMINNKEKAILYTKFLEEDNSYFKGSTYDSAKSLSEVIDSVRMLVVEDEEIEFKTRLVNNKVFKEKYEAIYKLYKTYINYLNEKNETDYIQEVRNLIKLNIKIDLDILIIKGEELSPLNRKLLETCFLNVKEIEYRDLFNKIEAKINFTNLYKSKGYVHEVSNVFKIIADNNLPLDRCTIIYTDYNNYYSSIKEYTNILSIPVTYIDGVPALEFNSYRMLYLITKLNDGLYGYDVLMNLIKDKSFNYVKLIKDVGVTTYIDTFLEEIGDLKFSFDKEHNNQVYNNYIIANTSHKEEIEKFKEIFNKGIISLLKNYLIDDNPSISNKLINDLELYKNISNKDDFDYFKNILNTLINNSIAQESTISVCSIYKAKENIRENMFYIGNDSDSFHISLAENSYISDDKLEEFDKKEAKTSVKIANNKIEAYKRAIQIAFDLGSNVYVSYSEKDETKDLKKHNFISSLFDLQKQSEPVLSFEEFRKRFVLTNTYYGDNLLKEEKIIETYLDKTKLIISEDIIKEKEDIIKDLIDRRYSPTHIEDNIKCRKHFLIRIILGVKDKEDYDVFAKFAHPDFGSMFHSIMEFANENKSEDAVNKKAEEIFDMYCAKRNPILKIELDKDKEDFLDIVHSGLEYLKKKKKGEAESRQLSDLNINGKILHIKGFPDLVSGNEIIDYKAKTKIFHKEEDLETCIQALIYALMNSEKNIDHVEYYYPFFNKIIKTTYNEKNVIEVLNKFIDSIINNDFTAAKDILTDKEGKKKLDDICKYCNFNDICGRKK